jgi:hypothetical protein
MSKKKEGENKEDRNASPSAFGWAFQVGAGISLMLDYVKVFTHFKLEGMTEDIEITVGESKKIYAQAKSVCIMNDNRNTAKDRKKALATLKAASVDSNTFKLVYISNHINPLSSQLASAFTFGSTYDFATLSDKDKKTIIDSVGNDFPIEKFQVQILSFFGEGSNKFQEIEKKIEAFLQEALGKTSYSKTLLKNLIAEFISNAADRPTKKYSFNMTKRQVLFPMISVIIDQPVSEEEYARVCNHDNYNGVCDKYETILEHNSSDYEFFAQVIGDYVSKRKAANDKANYKYEFINSEWMGYEQFFMSFTDSEEREGLIKILLLNIIARNSTIEKIRRATNLS